MKFNNVFVVDDDKVHHFIIRKLLENNHIDVSPSFYENGFDALNDLKSKLENGENPPDLILLDINMPVLDGWQFLEEFRELRNTISSEITIHIISSSDSIIDMQRAEAFKDEVIKYHVKPMTNESIKEIFLP